jgi:hypothetical protein
MIKRCEQCGSTFCAVRAHARFDTDRCRVAWHRAHHSKYDPEPYRALQPPDTGADVVARLFRGITGADVDPQRLQDQADAARERAEVNKAESARRAEDLALAVKAARRQAELAFADWKAHPTSANLDQVDAASRNRHLLEMELETVCLHDQSLRDAVLRWAYR